MSWSYRILEKDGWLALHEVYYDDEGEPFLWTEDPITFVVEEEEGAKGVADALCLALADAESRSVLRIDGDKLVAKP